MKESNYNFVIYADEYGYWYNSFTDSFFRLSASLSHKIQALMHSPDLLRKHSVTMYERLCEGGFLVADEVDELNLIRERHYKSVHSKDYFLVLIPTLNCNFKCWYCIQDHIPSIMKNATFEALKKHIDFMLDEHHIESLHLDWFGGEPFMFFDKVIEPLSRYAIEKCDYYGIPFVNSSTTNGYYLSPSISKKLSDLKFRQFQITLDGEKKYHDRVKFMGGCQSAFEHVLRNVNTMLTLNRDVDLFLRINYTHKTLSKIIVNEVNQFIEMQNRSRIVITPKKVWQEATDKEFRPILQAVLNDFEASGYRVIRRDISVASIPCYVNKEYYNTINYNGNVLKCTACDDIHKDKTQGVLQADGTILWTNNFDKKCQSPTFENEECLNCKKLPVCMGVCPRDHLSGVTRCKYDVMDEVFEESLLDYLNHQYS